MLSCIWLDFIKHTYYFIHSQQQLELVFTVCNHSLFELVTAK